MSTYSRTPQLPSANQLPAAQPQGRAEQSPQAATWRGGDGGENGHQDVWADRKQAHPAIPKGQAEVTPSPPCFRGGQEGSPAA